MKIIKYLANGWAAFRNFLHLLGIARISLIMVILTGIVFFQVPQASDAVIALGNFGSFHHFVIISLAGLVFAFFVWYWARSFYYMAKYSEALKRWEELVVIHTPRILGGLTLLLLGLNFLFTGIGLVRTNQYGGTHLVVLGILYLVYMGLFLFFVYFRRKLFNLDQDILYQAHETEYSFMPIRELPAETRWFLRLSLIISLILLAILTGAPIHATIFLGDAATILLLCLIIWLPLLYMVLYGSFRLKLPLFLLLFILIAFFSLFNDNKNVRIMNQPAVRRDSMFDYYTKWDEYRRQHPDINDDEQLPVVMILSEGGGIRAAYWSAGLLTHIQDNYPRFSEALMGVYGVSGGSFGAAVYTSAIELFENNRPLDPEYDLRQLAADVVGKDYLSPVLAAMMTREFIQAVLPFPIKSFDYAKVFEKTWEYQWRKVVQAKFGTDAKVSLSQGFTDFYQNNPDYRIPPVYLGTTEVEDGSPFLISPFQFEKTNAPGPIPRMGTIGDFYFLTSEKDIRISTAALLSARFPYVGPAGIVTHHKTPLGFVDGGYFDNTGANAAYNTLIAIKTQLEKLEKDQQTKTNESDHSLFRAKVLPVVLYLRNGEVAAIQHPSSSLGALYQLAAPLNTIFATRSAQSVNAVSRLKDFVELYNGIFLSIDLYPDDGGTFNVPLGWALSKTVQNEIEKRIDEVLTESKFQHVLEKLEDSYEW